jgi:nitrite reductase (NADH) small subunit
MTVVDGRRVEAGEVAPVGPDRWVDVCSLSTLIPDRGVAALVDGRAVAVFRCAPDDELLAVDNVDPFSGASVLSRGIVGSIGGRPMVASPVHKHRFDLVTGAALDDPAVRLDTWTVRLVGDRVQVSSEPVPSAGG